MSNLSTICGILDIQDHNILYVIRMIDHFSCWIHHPPIERHHGSMNDSVPKGSESRIGACSNGGLSAAWGRSLASGAVSVPRHLPC
jgi:hypothetical protein